MAGSAGGPRLALPAATSALPRACASAELRKARRPAATTSSAGARLALLLVAGALPLACAVREGLQADAALVSQPIPKVVRAVAQAARAAVRTGRAVPTGPTPHFQKIFQVHQLKPGTLVAAGTPISLQKSGDKMPQGSVAVVQAHDGAQATSIQFEGLPVKKEVVDKDLERFFFFPGGPAVFRCGVAERWCKGVVTGLTEKDKGKLVVDVEYFTYHNILEEFQQRKKTFEVGGDSENKIAPVGALEGELTDGHGEPVGPVVDALPNSEAGKMVLGSDVNAFASDDEVEAGNMVHVDAFADEVD